MTHVLFCQFVTLKCCTDCDVKQELALKLKSLGQVCGTTLILMQQWFGLGLAWQLSWHCRPHLAHRPEFDIYGQTPPRPPSEYLLTITSFKQRAFVTCVLFVQWMVLLHMSFRERWSFVNSWLPSSQMLMCITEEAWPWRGSSLSVSPGTSRTWWSSMRIAKFLVSSNSDVVRACSLTTLPWLMRFFFPVINNFIKTNIHFAILNPDLRWFGSLPFTQWANCSLQG